MTTSSPRICKAKVLVTFLYDSGTMSPEEWALKTIAREIEDGDCIGTYEWVSAEFLTDEQVRDAELEMGGDGTFMLGGLS